MPLIPHTTDSLPYIDPPPSPRSLAAATAEIQSSLQGSGGSSSTLHPSLPPAPPPSSSPLIALELDRLSTASSSNPDDTRTKMQGGVDMSRYAALPTLPPPPASSSSSPQSSAVLQQAEQSLRQSHINATYLRLRNEQLELLERYGRNAWLVGNDTLEGILREKEKGLVETRGAVESVNWGRKAGQIERGEGEEGVLGLERRWRDGVGRGIEVGVAVRGVEERARRGG